MLVGELDRSFDKVLGVVGGCQLSSSHSLLGWLVCLGYGWDVDFTCLRTSPEGNCLTFQDM